MSTLLCRLVPPWAIRTENGFSGSHLENKDQEEIALILVELSQAIKSWGQIPNQSFYEELDAKNISQPQGSRILDLFHREKLITRASSAILVKDLLIEKLRNFIIEEEIAPEKIEDLTSQVQSLSKLLTLPKPKSVAWFSSVRTAVLKMNHYLERYEGLDEV